MSVLLLMVFAIALTPFSAFHNHHHQEETVCKKDHKDCGHRFHIHSSADDCLICKAHFEKNYTQTHYHYQLFREVKFVSKYFMVAQGNYAELITLALRGPPLA
ncbi:hypothetical protein [Pedobacter frigoris]|uniref:hypothetical protein n=1 Tax=Pedobacter frigoris TaxID=2571272 RepID=UPI00292F89DB|nr:hypothetical protein [Pedobacter frigoris]